ADHQLFKLGAQHVELENLLRAQACDRQATPRRGLHEPLVLQPAERLANRRTADAELFCHLDLPQRIARLVDPFPDGFEDGVIDGLSSGGKERTLVFGHTANFRFWTNRLAATYHCELS